ncbi:unnamed protein product [Protopolystoma xenopodis]|uniref:Uncharacterized protein n=1 Tax=Protopolystoma xenopodis TaxID=117903 RepID=A0A3S4ZUD6_9PLAT|nr:unnamed protein product [Protopolystoma xenopodis]
MARLAYVAGETSGHVQYPRSDFGNEHEYDGHRTRCVPLSLPTNMTKVKQPLLSLIYFDGFSDFSFSYNQQKEKFEIILFRIQFLPCAQPTPIFEPSSVCKRFSAHLLFAEWNDESLLNKSDHMNTCFSNPI